MEDHDSFISRIAVLNRITICKKRLEGENWQFGMNERAEVKLSRSYPTRKSKITIHHDSKMGTRSKLLLQDKYNETTAIAAKNFSADCIIPSILENGDCQSRYLTYIICPHQLFYL